jgi:hypothetical protein
LAILTYKIAPSKTSYLLAISLGIAEQKTTDLQCPYKSEYFLFTDQFPSTFSFQFGPYSNRAGGQGFFDNGISTLQFPLKDLEAMYDQILPEYDWNFGKGF